MNDWLKIRLKTHDRYKAAIDLKERYRSKNMMNVVHVNKLEVARVGTGKNMTNLNAVRAQ